MHHRTAGDGSSQDACCMTFFKRVCLKELTPLFLFFFRWHSCYAKQYKSGSISAPRHCPPSMVLLDIIRSELHGTRMKAMAMNLHLPSRQSWFRNALLSFGNFCRYHVYFENQPHSNEQYQVAAFWTWRLCCNHITCVAASYLWHEF